MSPDFLSPLVPAPLSLLPGAVNGSHITGHQGSAGASIPPYSVKVSNSHFPHFSPQP